MNFTQLLEDIREAGIGQPEKARWAVTVTLPLGDGLNCTRTIRSPAHSAADAISDALRELNVDDDQCGHLFLSVRPA